MVKSKRIVQARPWKLLAAVVALTILAPGLAMLLVGCGSGEAEATPAPTTAPPTDTPVPTRAEPTPPPTDTPAPTRA